ncbi:MAG TPA: tetratricopeptide repeat protein, partial [Bryobacteraceae bacterium]|nr:tetratricopeptide repeat protein [Bryobacteraceae bacterium]
NRNGNSTAAVPLYERAIKLDPEQLSGSGSLGALRLERSEDEEAIRLWQDALAKNPALVLVRGNLATLLRKKGDRPAAARSLREALYFSPFSSRIKQLLEQVTTPDRR